MSENPDSEALEGQIHELEVMMNSVLQNSSDYVLTVGQNLSIIYFNRPLPGMNVKQAFGLFALFFFVRFQLYPDVYIALIRKAYLP